MPNPRRVVLASAAMFLVACNPPSSSADAGVDAGVSGEVDAGVDGGVQACSSVVDLATDTRVSRTANTWQATLELSGAGSLPLPVSCGTFPSGSERVVRLVTPRRARVDVSSTLVSGGAHSLWVSSTCGGAASQCFSTARSGGAAGFLFPDLPAGTELFFTVDVEGTSTQSLELLVTFTPLASVGEACFEPDLRCGDADAVCAAPGGGNGTCVRTSELWVQRCMTAQVASVGSVRGIVDFSNPGAAVAPSCRFMGAMVGFPEQVFAFTPGSTNTFVVRTDVAATHIDTIVSVRDACTTTSMELACSEDVSTTELRSSLVFNGVAGRTYYLVVQASSNAGPTPPNGALDGEFELVIEAL